MNDRERFERWAQQINWPIRKDFDPTTCKRHDDCYGHPAVQAAWLAWQAAAKEAEQQRDELLDSIDQIAAITTLDDDGFSDDAAAEIQAICRRVKARRNV